MTGPARVAMVAAASVALASWTAAADVDPAGSAASRYNDYPTEARVDYVFGCMAVAGNGRDIMRKCACSIDVIASLLPYDKYVEAETVLSMRQQGGERMAVFRSAGLTQNLVADLRRAQAEAEIVCFE